MAERLAYLEGSEQVKELFHTAAKEMPAVIVAIATETGLFAEREIKMRTPVDYGRLKASIGHFTPSDLRRGSSGASAADAFWDMVDDDGITIYVGTNVDYAPFIEFGHSHPTGYVCYIEAVKGFRFVHPWTYIGAHMFEQGVKATERAFDEIAVRHFKEAGYEI